MSLRTALRRVSGSIVLLCLFAGTSVFAQEAKIAVIIDDVGHRLDAGRRALALPGPVAVAILPHAPFAKTLAAEAVELELDVLVHMPMQPSSSADPGPGALTLAHGRGAIGAALAAALAAVPQAIGINNHMGSLYTRDAQAMDDFMAELAQRPGLIFVDSYTTHLSVGLMKAREHGIAALKRDVFVDADLSADALEAAWQRLLSIARERGFAVAIAHPHPDVLALLEREIAALDDIELVALSTLLGQPQQQRSYAEQIGQVPTGDFITSQRVH